MKPIMYFAEKDAGAAMRPSVSGSARQTNTGRVLADFRASETSAQASDVFS
jgi:hypothetical protein